MNNETDTTGGLRYEKTNAWIRLDNLARNMRRRVSRRQLARAHDITEYLQQLPEPSDKPHRGGPMVRHYKKDGKHIVMPRGTIHIPVKEQ